jgi:hypothetical protein
VLWKLDRLSEYDVRRPMTPTGTDLLRLVKHLAYVEMGYFGAVFGRPVAEAQRWLDDDIEPNADLWATADESREDVVALYHRAWAHADATIDALPLRAGHDNLPAGDQAWWASYRDRLEGVAREAGSSGR